MRRTAWVEINLNAIAHNVKIIRKLTGKNKKIIAVVKSNAYGHGAGKVAKYLEKSKVDMFGVVTLGEALELKSNSVKTPVLIMTPVFLNQIPLVVKNGFRQTVCSFETAKALSKEAEKQRKNAFIHIKVDTGMGRLGVPEKDAVVFAEKVKNLKNIVIEGLFTHFSSADEKGSSYTRKQIKRFKEIIKKLKKINIKIPIIHSACSAAVMKYRESYFDAVRPGIMLYGVLPYKGFRFKHNLKPVMSLKTRILFIKELDKGKPVSYSRTFFTKRKTRIAVLGAGYVDGYSRKLSNTGEAMIRGRKVPVLGRVCMDQTVIDITGLKNVKTGDEVVLMGNFGKLKISAEDIAEKIGTIPYDVVCMINSNLERLIK